MAPLCLAGETADADGQSDGGGKVGQRGWGGRGALKTPTESLQKGETRRVTELIPWSQPYRP